MTEVWIAVTVGLVVVALALVTVVALRQHSHVFGGRTVVRCRHRHLFTTMWIPGASFKAVRLGSSRFQHCPVGQHWTTVRPVDPTELSDDERRVAASHEEAGTP
ncbi:MAG: hypothetical protein ACYDEN_02210 [Acidimicrobiales bacterium]